MQWSIWDSQIEGLKLRRNLPVSNWDVISICVGPTHWSLLIWIIVRFVLQRRLPLFVFRYPSAVPEQPRCDGVGLLLFSFFHSFHRSLLVRRNNLDTARETIPSRNKRAIISITCVFPLSLKTTQVCSVRANVRTIWPWFGYVSSLDGCRWVSVMPTGV